ncbi:MAG: DUF6631 family protein [Pseudomonadota bacterium]
MEDAARELEVLTPASIDVEAGGERIAIAPLKVGQLAAFLRAAEPLLQDLASEEIDWLGLLARHGERLVEACAVACGKPRAWIEALAPDEFLRLAAAVAEVNGDFFVRRLLPALQEAAARLSGAAGWTRSSS